MTGEWELVALSGPDKDRRWPIRGEMTRIGRGEGNDVLLGDPQVSREHLVIERAPDGALILRVMPQTTNDTLVDGGTVERGGSIPISEGARIAIRETVLTICPVAAPPPSPTLRISDGPEDLGLTRASRPAAACPVTDGGRDAGGEWRFARLVRLIESLAEATSVGELYDRTLEGMFEALLPDRAFVADYIEETGDFRRVHGRTREGIAAGSRMSRNLLDCARRQKTALLLRHERPADPFESESYRQIGIQDFMCVPFFTGPACERFEGIFYFDVTTRTTPSFTEQDLEFATAAARIFSRHLEALRLREDLLQENERLKLSFSTEHSLIGSSPAMQELMRKIERYAPQDRPVLITGETGTGKELIARAIHRRSSRSACPFVAFNCGAISRSLLEAELFGAEKGSFTGCDRQIKGKFELADSGILFLDEVGELPIEIQPAFLRVLEGQEFYRLGGQQPLRVNVRLIAATHRDLEKAVEKDLFRQDLFFRLAVLRIASPPLRERGDDVIELAEAFIQRSGAGKTLSRQAEKVLREYPWPGNVRELMNVMERAIVNSSGKTIAPGDFDLKLDPRSHGFELRIPSLAEVEKRHIEFALERLDWNITRAAALLGINRQTLYDKLERYGLRPPES